MSNPLDAYTVSYAQNREDIVLAAFFPDVQEGFYVDVGANHPYYHSVTKNFYDQGWHGINIEPNPMLHKQLEEHRPNDINLMEGVGENVGELELRVYHSRDGLEGVSTLSKEMKDEYVRHENEDVKSFTDVKIKVTTLKDLFARFTQHVHFMKVDVEGFEYEVLKGNDWKKYRPELICIEANHIMKDWRPLLASADYELAYNDGLNDYYLAKECRFRKQHFDYAETFLLKKPIITQEAFERITSLQNSVNMTKEELKDKEEQLRTLQEFVSEITPLKNHLKRQIKSRTNKVLKKPQE